MNILVMVGDHPRNLILLQSLQKIKNIKIKYVLIFKREQLMPKPPKNLNSKISNLWKLHFKKRAIAEKKYFKLNKDFKKKIGPKIYLKNYKDLENKKIIKILKDMKAHACFISGVPILKKKILKILPKHTVNLHLGLIPHFKGSITGFWPFYFLQPTMLGTTFHIISKKVDTGEIIHQNTPKLLKTDGMHDACSKAILTALKDLKFIVKEIDKRIRLKTKIKIDNSLVYRGNVFSKKDWKPSMLKKIYVTYKDKIIKDYLNGKLKSKIPKLKKIKS